jgi:hypothetical protein
MWNRSRPRVTGVSLPFSGGGLSWSPRTREREVVRDLVIELQERRALFAEVEQEDEVHLNASIKEIRGMLTRALKGLVDLSEAYRLIEHLRAVCNTYLSSHGTGAVVPYGRAGRSLRPITPDEVAALVYFSYGLAQESPPAPPAREGASL